MSTSEDAKDFEKVSQHMGSNFNLAAGHFSFSPTTECDLMTHICIR